MRLKLSNSSSSLLSDLTWMATRIPGPVSHHSFFQWYRSNLMHRDKRSALAHHCSKVHLMYMSIGKIQSPANDSYPFLCTQRCCDINWWAVLLSAYLKEQQTFSRLSCWTQWIRSLPVCRLSSNSYGHHAKSTVPEAHNPLHHRSPTWFFCLIPVPLFVIQKYLIYKMLPIYI